MMQYNSATNSDLAIVMTEYMCNVCDKKYVRKCAYDKHIAYCSVNNNDITSSVDNNDVIGTISIPYKKKPISKALKIVTWNKCIGEEIGKAKCYCCELTEITQSKFHCGHVLAEVNGGDLHVDNLKPICESCNKSMGIKNMVDFKKQLISNNIDVDDDINIISNASIDHEYRNICHNYDIIMKCLLSQYKAKPDIIAQFHGKYSFNNNFIRILDMHKMFNNDGNIASEYNVNKIFMKSFDLYEKKNTIIRNTKIIIYYDIHGIENLNKNDFINYVYQLYKNDNNKYNNLVINTI